MSYEEEKQDRKIEQLGAEIERLRADGEQYERCIAARSDVIDQQATRIKELEDALVEYQRLGKTISEAVVPCLTAHGNCDQCRPKAKAACDAIETIRKGKIGSGDHIGEPNKLIGPDAKPRSWQITDEREKAIWDLSGISRDIGCDKCHPFIQKYYGHSIQVLRAMLEEAGQ